MRLTISRSEHGKSKREDFGDAVINTLSEYAPNMKDIILHRQVLSPWDIEQRFGLTEGNIFQGELSLDQLFFLRPAAGWAQFRTPSKKLLFVRIRRASGRGCNGSSRQTRSSGDFEGSL